MSDIPAVPSPSSPSLYKCPHCSSENIRPSQRSSRFAWFHSLRGLQKYRCRECRKSFFVPVSNEAKRAFRENEAIRRKRKRGWKAFIQGSTERRTMELLLFLSLLIIFYLALNAILKSDGS